MKAVSLFIALRYSRPSLRAGLSGLLSLMSLLGLVLGVFTLIVVTSVMNGFEKELQSRLLSVLPHAQVLGPNWSASKSEANERAGDWRSLRDQLAKQPSIRGVAPYVDAAVMLSIGERVEPVRLTGIDLNYEKSVSPLARRVIAGDLDRLESSPYGIVLGSLLARQLGVIPGDKVQLVVPRLHITPLGAMTRQRSFEVVAIFEVGADLDRHLAMVNLRASQKMLSLQNHVTGLRLAVVNQDRAETVVGDAMGAVMPNAADRGWRVVGWKQANAGLFRAVMMEKIMIFVLLLCVVAVASFNIVSIVLMKVTDKRGDIAVLRTMGADASTILKVFMLHGMLVGVAGTLLGAVLGVLVAPNIGSIVMALEQLGGWQLFDPTVYYIPYLPSELHMRDVFVVVSSALVISLLATFYPAIKASKISPAEALAYER